MRILKFHFVLFIVLSSVVFGQEVKVNKINQITDLSQGEFYYPKFSPDNSKIFFTSANYKGIWFLDLNTQKINNITDQDGAGYEFVFSADGKDIIYRTSKFEGMLKFYSIIQQNIASGSTKTVELEKRGIYPPQVVNQDKISYAVNNQVNSLELSSDAGSLKRTADKPVVIIDNSKIVLFNDGQNKVLAPLGEGNYIWPSVSPDGTKLLFTFTGHGTYTSDLDGNIISELGYANAPQWSPDGKWVIYMVDKDDRTKVTGSDVFISSADGTKKIQITNTKDVFEMYPVWSADGKKAAFNSENGKVFIVDLNID